jgi:hypothetical protein
MTPGSVTDARDHSVNSRWTVVYRLAGLCLAMTFAVVGMLFLLLPGEVIVFFNGISLPVGFEPLSAEGAGFYRVLAVGYMYVVTLLAWFMYRVPANRFAPLLLVNAKLASSMLSFLFFFAVHGALIFLVNGIVDGLIGGGVLTLYLKQWRRA